MKSGNILKDLFVVFPLSLSIISLVASVLIGIPNLQEGSGKIIINIDPHRMPVFGEAGNVLSVFAILLIVIVVNSILVVEIYSREKFLAYMLSVSTVIISLVIFVATWMVVSLN